NCEHEVSLASATAVAAALAQTGYQVVRLTIGTDGTWHHGGAQLPGLADAVRILSGCDAVRPVLPGPHGEDGTPAALGDLAGAPCVGSARGGGARGRDKPATRLIAAVCGTAPARAVVLPAAAAAGYRWTRPVVVKPVAAGSSRGVTLVGEPAQLPGALAAALALGDRVLAEDVITGREIDLAILGRPDGTRMVAPALEIGGGGIFSSQAKYGGKADLRVPAALSDADRIALETAAVTMFSTLGCAGVARIDFFLTTDGPLLNEVNTTPGFTEHSQVPRMFAAPRLPYPQPPDPP